MRSALLNRTRRLRSLLPLAMVLAASPGCGPAESQSSPTPSSPEDQLIGALCDGLAGCCSTEKFAFNRAGCEGKARTVLESRKPSSSGSVLDTAAVTRCANEVRQAIGQCKPTPTTGACAQLYVGTVATNKACIESSDCAAVNGAEVYCANVCYARHRGALGDTCQGTCQNSLCSYDMDPGVDHAVCNIEDNLACINGKCAAAPSAGQACANGRCANGFRCTAALSCVAEAAVGADCSNAPCVAGAYCGDNICAAQLPAGSECSRTGNKSCLSGSCSVFVNNIQTCAGSSDSSTWSAAACAGNPSF
jgi:hypothetical protein